MKRGQYTLPREAEARNIGSHKFPLSLSPQLKLFCHDYFILAIFSP